MTQFQSTLPAWGETRPVLSEWIATDNFNPLSPHGERQSAEAMDLSDEPISIHSPRMGRDTVALAGQHLHILFQSTLPAWGETARKATYPITSSLFQSTLPAWGETAPSHGCIYCSYFNPLSPHGERQQTHTTFRREKLAHLHNIVSFRQQRGSSC